MTEFASLGLAKPLLSALAAEGYTQPTPIQAQAIPLVLTGRDLLGIAQTGTGKTAAFALPILHRLAENRKAAPRRGCRCLVLSPTRELATQIGDSFKAYGANLGLTVQVVFGGVKYGPQVRALAGGVDVLVATPGRLIDHLNEKVANLSEVEVLVLDEADQMLDMGFIQPIRRIVKGLPHRRQNLFFSATMPREIEGLAAELLRDPAKVSVTPQATTVEKIDQKVLFVEAARKRVLLAELFDEAALKRVLVFTRTKRGADRVAKGLTAIGVEAASIHGDKTQGQRERALAAFKAGEMRALVATDIAARGIDVDGVTHVIQFELPNVPEAYVHRIGRTARAGANGHAIALVADDERPLLKDIEKVTRQRIPSWDRRNDRALGAAQAALAATEPQKKPQPQPQKRR
ncbi:MAG: DEAD/DEAH box helicase, partial [Pseudomonadota bacterium]